MKRLFTKLALVGFVAFIVTGILSADARALTVEPTPLPLLDSALVITGYQVVAGHLVYVQIYNSSDEPVGLVDWNIEYKSSVIEADRQIGGLSDWIEPGKHLVIGSRTAFGDSLPFVFDDIAVEDGVYGLSVNLRHTSGQYKIVEQPVKKDVSEPMHRTKTSSGNYSSSTNFTALTGDLLSDVPYKIPAAPDIQLVEVLANASDCSPFDTSSTCSDYVKLRLGPEFDHNDGDLYRLRVGYKGLADSITNNFSLEFGLMFGGYMRVNQRDDGDVLSLPDSGAYIWLEDKYGLIGYEGAAITYPSASSKSKIGWAWALDDNTGAWSWTASPQPDSANIIYLPPEVSLVPKPVSLVACGPGKYRNPDTNRCKSIVASTNLSPCSSGQVRNPETNRCRSLATTASSLTPCKPDQERNPATNRCRSILASATSLVPCKAGYERNPETNRCRKSVDSSHSLGGTAVKSPTEDEVGFPYGSVVLGSMGVAAVSYGVYEWRRELMGGVRRLVTVLGKK